MGTRSSVQSLRVPLVLLMLATPVLPAKKVQPVLEWRDGVLWELPDSCNETSPLFKETFIILGDDIVYHLSHNGLIGRKPNLTERKPVKYAIAQGDFYLQDEDGRVFKLSVVKKEQDPTAQQQFKSGKQPCQP